MEFFIVLMALIAVAICLAGPRAAQTVGRMRKRRLGGLALACLLVALFLAPLCQAGDVMARRADTWSTATGTNIAPGLWESWTVKQLDFHGLNPTNTAVTVTVRYGAGSYTQSVTTVTGDASGRASFSNAFYAVSGDQIVYTPGAVSTGKVTTTYAKHNP